MSDSGLFDLTVHHLRFRCCAQTPIHLGPQAGAQIRGGLWQSLETIAPGVPVESDRHPLYRLMEMERDSARGSNPARPLAIRPPLAPRAERDRNYRPGETFDIGITLYGDAAVYFPYIALAMNHLGQNGTGYGRGRFVVSAIHALNERAGMMQDLLDATRHLRSPQIPLTGQQVRDWAAHLPADKLRIRFLTPTQIRHQGRFLAEPNFCAIIARLLERCQALEYHYGSPAPAEIWERRHSMLTMAAQDIRIVQDNTRWVSAQAGSRRSNRRLNLGGFVGEVLLTGNLEPFREWLLWGEALHVGKNAIKGDGWYEIGPA